MNYGRGFGGLPPVVKNLLIINVIVFVVTRIIPFPNVNFDDLLALHYYKSDLFRPHQFISYMFMHAPIGNRGDGIMHIFFNMFALFMFGRTLEMAWGPKRFLTFYMLTGIGAGLTHLAYTSFQFHHLEEAINAFASSPSAAGFVSIITDNFNGFYNPEAVDAIHNALLTDPNNTEVVTAATHGLNELYQIKASFPMVGASGAVFGLLAGFGMMFPNTELMMLFFPVPIKAKYFVIIYAGIELFMGVQNNPSDNVAHFAHLGGALFGFIIVMIWNRSSKNTY
jgi:membrane associated rhomboid family serine protease